MDVTYCSDLTEKPPEPYSPRPVYREGRPGHEYLASFMYDLMVNHFVERVYPANLAAIGHLKVTRVQTSPYHAIAYQVAHVGQDNEIAAGPARVSRSVSCWFPVDLESVHVRRD